MRFITDPLPLGVTDEADVRAILDKRAAAATTLALMHLLANPMPRGPDGARLEGPYRYGGRL